MKGSTGVQNVTWAWNTDHSLELNTAHEMPEMEFGDELTSATVLPVSQSAVDNLWPHDLSSDICSALVY